jgi:signal transduction histidine kinase
LILDVRTIYMMNAVVYLMLHGIIWVSLARYQNRVVALWSVSGIVSAVGVIFLGSLGLMPEWIAAIFGQVLMAAGNYGRQYALRSIVGTPSVRWAWGQGLFNLAYLGVNGALFFTGASYEQMMVVFFGFYAINCFDYFLAGRQIARQSDSAGARSVQWGGLVFTSTLGMKFVSMLGGWGAAGMYDAGWDQMVLFAGQFMAISLVNFGLMQILVDQFQRARVQAEDDLLVQRERTAQVEQHSLDLTQLLREREEIIRQLTLSNKTAGMGALMSSIAHEINQPLTTIVLKTELIQSYLTAPEGAQEVNKLCAQIRDDAHRAGGMIRTLRNMFTIGRGAFEKLNFADMLRDVASIVRSRTDRQGIALLLDVPASLPLTGDATQLQQVVLNLFNNAIDAVSAQGLSAALITVQGRLHEGMVELRVQDNGRGIDPAVQRDVFALFKSPAARDMGVGLWLSQAVVESHGGKLDFESTPGQGTLFSLRLPVRDYILAD